MEILNTNLATDIFDESIAVGGVERCQQAFQIRTEAARHQRFPCVLNYPTNGDEALYPNKIGNFSKGLTHLNNTGEVDK